jgi:hypothetical protein
MGLPRFWGGIPGVATWKVGVYYISLALGLIGFIAEIGSIKPEDMAL